MASRNFINIYCNLWNKRSTDYNKSEKQEKCHKCHSRYNELNMQENRKHFKSNSKLNLFLKVTNIYDFIPL